MQLTSPTYLTLSGLLLAISSTVATPLNVFQTRNPSMKYVGCYSDSGTTGSGVDWTYQSTGWCQDHCIADSSPAFALTAGDSCICADYLPDDSDKVDDSKCGSPCTGWPSDMCGGSSYYSIYETGLVKDVSTKPDSSSSSGSSSSNSTSSATNGTSTASSSGTPSGATQVVTSTSNAQAAAAAAEEQEKQKNAGAHDTASIAAGVVVGVVGIAALAGGAFFFFYHRKQKSPGFSRSQMPEMSDARYDGGYITNRRPSEDSIDYPDFSREVLQVTNPDRHY